MKSTEIKTIGIDGRCLMDENYTGVSEYTVALIKKILKDYPDKKVIIFLNSFKRNGAQERLSWLQEYKNVRVKHYYIPSKFLNLSLWLFRYPKLDNMLGGVDVFIAPNISFLAVSKKCKFILTVHDLSFERFKETFSWKRRFWHFIINPRELCQRVDEIWTVSKSTKWDLESLYKISPEKIKVKAIVRNLKNSRKYKISKSKLEKIRKEYLLPRKFILYLGTVEPRKNIKSIVEAFDYLREHKILDKKYKLVIAGQLGWRYEGIINSVESAKFTKDIILTNFIAQEDKGGFYQLASVFVYPSLFEGFGIPVLEAMANATPVITSNNSSLPEVLGDTGIMIDPDRVGDLVDAVELLVGDAKLRQYYIKKGLERAEKIVKNSNEVTLL